jgi:threonine/homoserine/homoserine lactone efflux protein
MLPLVWAYVLTCLLVEITPGPNMGYLTLLSATRGRIAGLWFALGAALGISFYGLVTAFGLHKLLLSRPDLYLALQWMGVAYFLFLAWEAWSAGTASLSGAAENSTSNLRYFRRGVTTNLLNPKLLLFYAGVMPRFLDRRGATSVNDMLLLVAIYVIIATTVHVLLVMIASQFSSMSAANSNVARRVYAVLFLLLTGWMVLGILRP